MGVYDIQIASAKRQIAAKGRIVEFRQLDVAPADRAKPWRGAENPRQTGTGANLVSASAVFVPITGQTKLGSRAIPDALLLEMEQTLITAPDTPIDDFNEIVDADGTTWRILLMDVLRPGDATIMYFLGVAR